MSTRGQVYFDRNFLHFQSADIRGLTARPHATPGLFRGQPRSKSRTPERHMRFAVRRRGQVKPYLTDRGQPRSMLGPLLEVEMSKKCTPFGHEAHVQVKMYKAHQVRTTFGS